MGQLISLGVLASRYSSKTLWPAPIHVLVIPYKADVTTDKIEAVRDAYRK
jgi:hypothetical protein